MQYINYMHTYTDDCFSSQHVRMKWIHIKMGTYQVQTNLSVQTMKLQSESLDQHPRGMVDQVILQSGPTLGLGNHTFANPPSHLSAPLPLDVDLMAQIKVSIEVSLHLICSLLRQACYCVLYYLTCLISMFLYLVVLQNIKLRTYELLLSELVALEDQLAKWLMDYVVKLRAKYNTIQV